VPLPGPAKLLDVNYLHSCAVLQSGQLYCWGENVETQLGQGDAPDENQSSPVRVADFTDVLAVSCGQGHTLALRASGDVYGWGRNTTGQVGLGEGTPERIRVPTLVNGASSVTKLDAGQDSACALRENGELLCWGSGLDQHLGNQMEGTVFTPLLIAGVPPFESLSLDTFHTCAIDRQSRLWCWGRAIEGQLGLGDNRRLQAEPIEVPSPSAGAWHSVAVGRFFTCGLTSDERVWCSGSNTEHQLATPDTERRNVFTEVILP
jgi:alpha-tubulin suppressor-like RCC1 family protein